MNEMRAVFTGSQHMIAKHFYALLSGMTPEQLQGAGVALATLTILVEDGYLSVNQKGLEVDFFTHCYDSIVGISLAMKMLKDDGVIGDEMERVVKDFSPDIHLREAELALSRIETLLRQIANNPDVMQ
jgi:hypothetical protein